MAIYSERNANTILTFATDPEGDPLFISKVNGDPGLVGAAVGLSIGGTATVAFDGTVTYDDTGLPTISVGTELADSLIATVSDGLNEVDITVNLEILGIADTSAVSGIFGVYTRAGAGGIPVTGTAITAGNGDGYFTITGGRLMLTNAGQGNLAPGGQYALTFDDASSLDVTIAPNRFDVDTEADLISACQAAYTISPTIDFEIVIRDGTEIGSLKTKTNLRGLIMQGSLIDPNNGVANSLYDINARADFSGGSITIRSETPLGATINTMVQVQGCDKIRFDGINFRNAALDTEPLAYSYANNALSSGAIAGWACMQVKSDSSWPHKGDILIQNCDFGNPAKAHGHLMSSCEAININQFIVQDCSFDKVRLGPGCRNSVRFVATGNFVRSYLVDCFRCGGHNVELLPQPQRTEVIDNVVLGPIDDENFANEHCDVFQYADQSDLFGNDLFLHKNYFYSPVNSRNKPGYASKRSSQGIFGNQNGSGEVMSGEISNNFVLVSAVWAIYVDGGANVVVKNNTIINDTISDIRPDSAEPKHFFKSNCTGCVSQDNIAGDISGEAGAGVVFLNNVDSIDSQALAGGNTYAAVFDGPFGFEVGRGATFTVDTTDAASIKTDIDTIFTPKTGGGGEGKGHLG